VSACSCDGRGSRARYRRAVEARVEEWEREARRMRGRAAGMRKSTSPFQWAEPTIRHVETRARVYADAARRARAILERLGER
jgi:hypothetical protein